MVFSARNQLRLNWHSGEGKLLKSLPAKLKKEFPEDLQKWKEKLKKDKKYLSNRKKEIDRTYIKKQFWDHDEFRKKFIDHPLTVYSPKN